MDPTKATAGGTRRTMRKKRRKTKRNKMRGGLYESLREEPAKAWWVNPFNKELSPDRWEDARKECKETIRKEVAGNVKYKNNKYTQVYPMLSEFY